MKKLLFTLLGLAAALTLPAQDFKITHGPWLCDMTEDGVTVLWTTNKPALSWVEATEDDGRSFYAAEHTRHYETVAGRKQAHKTLHAVRLNNLRPGTKYCYRIFSQEVLEWKHGDNVLYGRTVASNVYKRAPFRFRTFPATGTDCSFVILNDIHGRADDMTELCREINFGKHDFVMLNGDMSNSIENEEQLFRDFIDASVNLYASETPILYNRGNHETRGVFADRLHDYFPTRNGRHYQLCKVGSVCFLLLDCGEDKPDTDIEYGGLADYDAYRREECEWLRRAVASETFRNASARVVFLHIPLDGGTWHGSNHLRNLFLPILNEAGINIMFSGHTHRYGFHPANNEVRFPVVVNGNQSYIRCDMTGDRIAIRIVGPGGRVAHTRIPTPLTRRKKQCPAPKRCRASSVFQRKSRRNPLRLSRSRSLESAAPICFSTVLTLMLSRSAISRFFRPVVRLNRNTRRHCSESPEMQQSISSLNCDNWNSSSIWSATSVRIQTSNSSSPDSPPRHFLERSKSMARFFTATNSSGSSGRSKSTSSRRSHKARKTSCTMSSDALRSWTI